MATFVVMEPPAGSGAVERTVLLRDGFAFLAFLFAPLWLLWHRLWIEAALAFAAILIVGLLDEVSGFRLAAPLLSLLVSFYVGLEGSALRANALSRRGWLERGVVVARDAAEAEIRFADGFDPVEDPVSAPVTQTILPAVPARSNSGPALGLFGYPGLR